MIKMEHQKEVHQINSDVLVKKNNPVFP